MASTVLYPPIVDSTQNAFLASSMGGCIVYFRFSQLSFGVPVKSVQVRIVKQDTNLNVVNRYSNIEEGRFSSTGILLDVPYYQSTEADDLYYIRIKNSDLDTVRTYADGTKQTGFIPGWIYKIQLRISSVNYYSNNVVSERTEADWLTINQNRFSEWSTTTVVKAISDFDYKIDLLEIDTTNSQKQTPTSTKQQDEDDELEEVLSTDIHTLNVDTLVLTGRFYPKEDKTEDIYCIKFLLWDDADNLIENTGEILMNQFQDNLSFNYTMKTTLKEEVNYKLGFQYETRNKFVGGFYEYNDEVDERYWFVSQQILGYDSRIVRLVTIDNNSGEKFPINEDYEFSHKDSYGKDTPMFAGEALEEDIDLTQVDGTTYVEMSDITSMEEEEAGGYIALKFFSNDSSIYGGNLCIRRTDSRSNFQVWEDIHIEVVRQKFINQLPMWKDYSVESGIQYKYGVQVIDTLGHRGLLFEQQHPSIRIFQFSYLFRKGQQLKLRFDNSMDSFSYQFSDSKIDTIGGTYPRITRNAATKYRTFPINGLISFNMDENGEFITRKALFNNNLEVIDNYTLYNQENEINPQYDYTYERFFREEVLKWLQDGEFKLFKSPTEGNVIVRLIDISCTPQQSLGRLIYSFSGTAYEMADNTFANYIKYGIIEVGDWATEFKITYTLLGQIQYTFNCSSDNPTNLFERILERYDSQGESWAGVTRKVKEVSHVRITFEDPPMRIDVGNGQNLLGYQFILNGRRYNVFGNYSNGMGGYSPFTIYEIDERIKFTTQNGKRALDSNSLTFVASSEASDKGKKTTLTATVDFLMVLEQDTYREKEILNMSSYKMVGQYSTHAHPGDGVFREAYDRLYIEWYSEFRRLQRMTSIELEADPYSVFELRDYTDLDTVLETHIVGETGVLHIEQISDIRQLIYAGKMVNDVLISDDVPEATTDLNATYLATVIYGTYKVEQEGGEKPEGY